MNHPLSAAGKLNIAFGVAGILVGSAALLVAGGPGELQSSFIEPMLGYAVTCLVMFQLAIGLPCIFAGAGLLRLSSGARTAMVIISVINILNPLGTLLSIYTLAVLMSPAVEPLFDGRPQPSLMRAGPTAVAGPAAKATGSILAGGDV